MIKKMNLLMLVMLLFSSSAFSGNNFSLMKGVDSSLKPKVSADDIMNQAKQGKYLPIKFVEKPINAPTFQEILNIRMKKNLPTCSVAVVVDEDHAKAKQLYAMAKELIHGQKGTPGLAQTTGARINEVLLIQYNKSLKAGIEVGQIIIAINDYNFPRDKEGRYLSEISDAREYLKSSFEDGVHLVTKSEYLSTLEKEMARVERKMHATEENLINTIHAQILLENYASKLSDSQVNALAREVYKHKDMYQNSNGELDHNKIYKLARSRNYL